MRLDCLVILLFDWNYFNNCSFSIYVHREKLQQQPSTQLIVFDNQHDSFVTSDYDDFHFRQTYFPEVGRKNCRALLWHSTYARAL